MRKKTGHETCHSCERPIPSNCYELWTRNQPAEHYFRLVGERHDEEAVLLIEKAEVLLLDLILCRLKKVFDSYYELHCAGNIYDQAHHTWCHIIGKIKEGKLEMREPNRFYGMLKLIIDRCLIDEVRKNSWNGIILLFGDLLQKRASSLGKDEDDLDIDALLHEMKAEGSLDVDFDARVALHQTLLALAKDAPMGDRERKALKLSVYVKTGLTELKSNSDIAKALSVELGEEITYQQAATLIHSGMAALKSFLESIRKRHES